MKNRNTLQKRLIKEALWKMRNHPTAEEVYNSISNENPLISRATVYRNLKLLVKMGECLHIPIPDGADCFDYNTLPHYHLKCKKCNRVFDIDMPYQENLCEKIRNLHEFEIESHQILFSGICPKCKKEI